jgi:hypothetical protein
MQLAEISPIDNPSTIRLAQLVDEMRQVAKKFYDVKIDEYKSHFRIEKPIPLTDHEELQLTTFLEQFDESPKFLTIHQKRALLAISKKHFPNQRGSKTMFSVNYLVDATEEKKAEALEVLEQQRNLREIINGIICLGSETLGDMRADTLYAIVLADFADFVNIQAPELLEQLIAQAMLSASPTKSENNVIARWKKLEEDAKTRFAHI